MNYPYIYSASCNPTIVGKQRATARLSQCQRQHTCHDVQKYSSSLPLAFCDVSSLSMDPEGKRSPLRGHEKGTGRLSQHWALACSVLKAQIHILSYFIFFLPLPSVCFCPSPSSCSVTSAFTHASVTAYGYLYFPQ